MINNKNLWCEKCKKFPNKIIERYLEPIEETREFDEANGNYGLVESNIDEIEFEQLCGTCRTILKFKK